MLNNLPLSHVIVRFVMDGIEYEVEDMKIKFLQPSDYKGQPQHEVRGGQIYMILTHAPTDSLYEWAAKSTMRKDGVITFQTEMSSPVLTIEFSQAYCVKLSLEIDAFAGTKTSIFISPESVKVNGITHKNYWR